MQGQIWLCQSKAHGYFQKVFPGVQPRFCRRFQDISNQKIVTLTFNPIKVIQSEAHGSNIVTLGVLDILHVKKYYLDFWPLKVI